MKLVFAGDPMCSWCYGFGKELTALTQRHPELQLQILVGGVRAGATDLLDDAGKQFRLGHWERVEQNSGLPFNRPAFLALENFVYDTEPVCRAVVTARRLVPQADQLAVFRALQHAFYADGLDTTDGAVLARVATTALQQAGHDVTTLAFRTEFEGAATIADTAAEFAYVRSLGIRSFPALLLETSDGLYEISPGYAHVEKLEQHLAATLRHVAPAQGELA
jgi:putative protein-disulfide isomerase